MATLKYLDYTSTRNMVIKTKGDVTFVVVMVQHIVDCDARDMREQADVILAQPSPAHSPNCSEYRQLGVKVKLRV